MEQSDIPSVNLSLTAVVPTVDTTDDIWVTALRHYQTSLCRMRVNFPSPKHAVYFQEQSPDVVENFTTHGTDVDELWEDDAQWGGSFIPQDSIQALRFKNRWFSLVGANADFRWSTSTEPNLHYSLAGWFYFMPLTDGGAFISDPKVDGQCLFSVQYDDTLGGYDEAIAAYWNNSKLLLQFHGVDQPAFESATLAVGEMHYVAWYNFWGSSSGRSSTKIVIDGDMVFDRALTVGTYSRSFPAEMESCDLFIGAKNLAGDNKYDGYLSHLTFSDPDEYSSSGQAPRGNLNTTHLSQWPNAAVLDYPDQNEWWGRPWGMSSLTGNGILYYPCDDATWPITNRSFADNQTVLTVKSGSNPTMQVPSFADAPATMRLGSPIVLNFDVGDETDPLADGWGHQLNLAGFLFLRKTVWSFWFRWAPNGTLPSTTRILNLNLNRISTDVDCAHINIDPAAETIQGYYGSFVPGSAVPCKPNVWHFLTVSISTSQTQNYFVWQVDGVSGGGGEGGYIQENAKYRILDWEIRNDNGAPFIDLDLAHIHYDQSDVGGAWRKRSDPSAFYQQDDKIAAVIAGPSYRLLPGVTTEYRDNSFWLNRNYWSCQITQDAEFVNEGINQATGLSAVIHGTLDYLQENGVVKGLPYTVGIDNSEAGNGFEFVYDPTPFGICPVMWVKFNSWSTAAQTTIASGPSVANDGPGLPWAEWFLEREAGSNRIRSRLTTISGRGFHYPMELITPWVDVGLGEWNFIAFGMYTCDFCSPPNNSKILMCVNGVEYESNVESGVFNVNYEPESILIGSDTVVTDGFSADFNCVFTQPSWDDVTHVIPAYLDGKPDTALVQAMGGDSFNFISRVNTTNTTLDYVSRPGVPSVFGFRPNTTGVTGAHEAGPVGSFDLAAKMSSTPKWIEVSDPSWGSSGTNVYILECAFKTSGHSGTGEFKMLCSNTNINGIYAIGLVHDNTNNTVKMFVTAADNTETRSTQSVAWPQNQYNHVVISRGADFTNDRADLVLNGVLAITMSGIHDGINPEYEGVFGGGFFGCVSGTCPTDSWISHAGFRMSDGLGLTELSLAFDHYDAFVLGDQPSGVAGEDDQCDLGRSDDHNHLAIWPRPVTATSAPASGTLMDVAALPINTVNPTWDLTDYEIASLPAAALPIDTLSNTWFVPEPKDFDVPAYALTISPKVGVWVASDKSDVNLTASSLPISPVVSDWHATEFNYIDLPVGSIVLTSTPITWFSSITETSNLPSDSIQFNLFAPQIDVEEKNFIVMKASYLPLKPKDQRFLATENHWIEMEVPNLPLVANGSEWVATEDRRVNTPTAQLALDTQAPEAFMTELHWSELVPNNIPINTQSLDWTPSRSTDRREIVQYDLDIARGTDLGMYINRRFRYTIGPQVVKWTLSAAQSTFMTTNLAKKISFVTPLTEVNQSFRIETIMTQKADIQADISLGIKIPLMAATRVEFTLDIQQKQEFTSPLSPRIKTYL